MAKTGRGRIRAALHTSVSAALLLGNLLRRSSERRLHMGACLIKLLLLTDVALSLETLKLVKVGWRTGDLTNAAFSQDARTREIETSETFEVYSSSSKALQALSSGAGDVFLECWQSSSAPCSSTPGTKSSLLGITGETSLYVSKSLLKRDSSLTSLDAFKNGGYKAHARDLRVIGSVRSWDDSKLFEDLLSQEGLQDLLERTEHFDSQAELNDAIVTSMKRNTPLLFTYFEPAAIPILYQVFRIFVDPAVLYNFFPLRPVYKVWRTNAWRPKSKIEIEIEKFQVDKGQMQGLLIDMAHRASVKLLQTDPSYVLALKAAAANRTCVLQGDSQACVAGGRWPRPRPSHYPEKVYVAMKLCPGFVGVLSDKEDCGDGEEMQELKTTWGYSVDHVYEVFENLGYRKEDIVLRCGSSTSSILRAAARDVVDVSLACITIKEDRQAIVDFSTAYYTTGYRLLVRKVGTGDSGGPGWRAFLMPFGGDVWLCFGIMVILLGFCLNIIEQQGFVKCLSCFTGMMYHLTGSKKNDGDNLSFKQKLRVAEMSFDKSEKWGRKRIDEEAQKMQVGEMIAEAVEDVATKAECLIEGRKTQSYHRTEEVLWHAWCRLFESLLRSIALVFTFLVGRDGYAEAMQSTAGKLVANLFVLLGTFLMALYTANLAAFMTAEYVSDDSIQVRSLQDTKAVVVTKCAAECQTDPDCIGNYAQQYLNTEFSMLSVVCVYNYEDIAKYVMEGKAEAGIYEEPILQLLASQSCNRLKVAGEAFGLQEYGYALPKGSVLTEGVSAAVTHLRMAGIHQDLHKKHFDSCSLESRGTVDETVGEGEQKLTMDDMRGLLGLFSGMLASLVLFACFHHCLTKHFCKKRKPPAETPEQQEDTAGNQEVSSVVIGEGPEPKQANSKQSEASSEAATAPETQDADPNIPKDRQPHDCKLQAQDAQVGSGCELNGQNGDAPNGSSQLNVAIATPEEERMKPMKPIEASRSNSPGPSSVHPSVIEISSPVSDSDNLPEDFVMTDDEGMPAVPNTRKLNPHVGI